MVMIGFYVPEYDAIISNGNIAEHGKVIWEESKILRFISYKGRWARVLPYTYYIGTLPPEETIRIVNYPSLSQGASCFIEKTCLVTTSCEVTRSRGLLSTGSEGRPDPDLFRILQAEM